LRDPATAELLRVGKEQQLYVTNIPASSNDIPLEVLTRYQVYRGFLLDGGGSKALNVDGSSTPQEFFVSAEPGVIKWITKIRFLFNDTSMELDTKDFRRFGTSATSPGLTNGIDLFVEQKGTETRIFDEPILTIGDFMNYATEFTNFVHAVSSQVDFLSFDFVPEKTIPIVEGSIDKIVCRINDDLTPTDLFWVLLFGYKEIL